jgi:hypothetical protein
MGVQIDAFEAVFGARTFDNYSLHGEIYRCAPSSIFDG